MKLAFKTRNVQSKPPQEPYKTGGGDAYDMFGTSSICCLDPIAAVRSRHCHLSPPETISVHTTTATSAPHAKVATAVAYLSTECVYSSLARVPPEHVALPESSLPQSTPWMPFFLLHCTSFRSKVVTVSTSHQRTQRDTAQRHRPLICP